MRIYLFGLINMRITLRQLELFAAICQEGTVTAAAARVGLSQAATSQALAETGEPDRA